METKTKQIHKIQGLFQLFGFKNCINYSMVSHESRTLLDYACVYISKYRCKFICVCACIGVGTCLEY